MLELNGHIDDTGTLKLVNRSMVTAWLNKNAGKSVEFKLSVKSRKRSHSQNEYYWAVIVPYAQQGLFDTGSILTKEETHDFIKAQFNSKEVELKQGLFTQIPQSTTSLTTYEFMGLIERIQQFAVQYLGVVIPDPESQTTLNYQP